MMGYWLITSYASAFCLIPLTVQQYTFIFLGLREALLELSVFPTTQHEDLGKSKTNSLLPRVQYPSFRARVVLILQRYHVSQPPNVCSFIKFQTTFSGLAE